MNVINKGIAIPYCQKIEILSIAGLLFILPFEGTNTIQEILFFFLISAFLVKNMWDYKNIASTLSLPNKALTTLMITSFLWGIIALIHAIDPFYSFRELMTKMSKQYLLYFLSFLIVREISFDRIKWLFFPLVLSTMIMSIYACYQFYQWPVFFQNRVTGFTGAFYRLSIFLVLSIPITTVFAFSFQGWVKRTVLFILPVSIAALFFTFTRAAWIAVVIEALILITIFLRKYRKFLILSVVIVFLVVSGLSYKSIIPNELILHGSEKPRIEALKHSLDIIRTHAITGIGYGKKTFSKYYPELEDPKHAHNIFLNIAIELGITGLVLFTAMVAVIIKIFTRAIRKEILFEKRLLITGIFSSLIGFLSLNLFDYMYHGWPGQIFWMLVGIGFALVRHTPSSTNERLYTVNPEMIR